VLLASAPSPSPYPNLWGVDWPTTVTILLGLTSVLLAIVTIVLVLCGIFAFLNLKQTATIQAEKTAHRIAASVAEMKANEYLQENFIPILSAYQEMMSGPKGASSAEADAIAREEGEENQNENDQAD